MNIDMIADEIPGIVGDDEKLYRAIRSRRCVEEGSEEYTWIDGRPRFLANAFNDRNLTPSVDRSFVRTDAREAKKSDTDGVAVIHAYEVRAISNVRVKPNNNNCNAVYEIDAVYDPIFPTEETTKENLAHCIVKSTPQITRTHFTRKIREALANLADKYGFVIRPIE